MQTIVENENERTKGKTTMNQMFFVSTLTRWRREGGGENIFIYNWPVFMIKFMQMADFLLIEEIETNGVINDLFVRCAIRKKWMTKK